MLAKETRKRRIKLSIFKDRKILVENNLKYLSHHGFLYFTPIPFTLPPPLPTDLPAVKGRKIVESIPKAEDIF